MNFYQASVALLWTTALRACGLTTRAAGQRRQRMTPGWQPLAVPWHSTAVGYNKVRLFYVVDAVQGRVRDLVVIKISTHASPRGTVQARQDGDGHGPPG